MNKITLVASLILAGLFFQVHGQNPQEVLKKMDDLMSAPIDRVATVQMTVTNKRGESKTREAELKQMGAGYRLYRYTKPENKAGIATLSLPDGKMWLYMPAFGKAIKITLLSKSQAFTGTDFSYEDMSGIPYSDRYTANFENSQNEKELLLNLSPKSKQTEYSRILLALNKQYGYPTQMAFYDQNGAYIKKADYNYTKQGGYWYAKEVVMTDLRKDHSTAIEIMNIRFDTGLSEKDFTIDVLKTPSESD
ncbi:MAG TPA: hypothetical protein DDY13_06595 [Cytophagales bacterium]|jgi:outer membrane lipoprotein-sorting protein|nr:hypothetical protein [Cytophagales bacterium]